MGTHCPLCHSTLTQKWLNKDESAIEQVSVHISMVCSKTVKSGLKPQTRAVVFLCLAQMESNRSILMVPGRQFDLWLKIQCLKKVTVQQEEHVSETEEQVIRFKNPFIILFLLVWQGPYILLHDPRGKAAWHLSEFLQLQPLSNPTNAVSREGLLLWSIGHEWERKKTNSMCPFSDSLTKYFVSRYA